MRNQHCKYALIVVTMLIVSGKCLSAPTIKPGKSAPSTRTGSGKAAKVGKAAGGAATARPATTAPTIILYTGPESEAVKDLRGVLQGYNAGEIRIDNVELGARTGQEFFLERRNHKTLVRYTVTTSLENAIYTLLNRWGFHWYGPGENWLVKPVSIPGANIAGRWHSPSFRNRTFFGSGGLDVYPANDPENRYKSGWYAWKRRNRFNTDFESVGHIGGVFYLENKELLDAHPEWFAGETGKMYGRLKIEIPEAVEAFKAWLKRKYPGASRTPVTGFMVLGVDPEDGRGGSDDPLPPDGFAGIEKWNHSDKWWWLANEVAKEYPENDSRIVVSMYAYGNGATNTLVPKFKLRKNVYPVIIPYAFQTGYLPDEMVKVWAGNISGKMGMYDYWNITQWSLGLPQFNMFEMKDKLKFWHRNKIDGLYIETTDAAGPMGHAWWLTGQLAFDLDKDFNALYSQYLTDVFGKAAPAMKKMYDRWSRSPQGAGDVGLSLADLKAADAMVAKGSLEWKRIKELKAYVHYMKLYHDHDGTQESKNRILEYLYSIHHLYMVQTSAMMGQAFLPPVENGNVVPNTMIKPATDEQIDAQFRANLLSDPKRYEVTGFRFDPTKATFTKPIDVNAWRFGHNPRVSFVAKTTGTISFDAGSEGPGPTIAVHTEDSVLLKERLGPDNSDYKETIGDRTWSMKKFQLSVTAGKTYHVRMDGFFNRFKMHSEVVVFNQHSHFDFDNYAYPTQYLYIPKNCNEIVFQDDASPAGKAGPFYAPEERGKLTDENYGKPVGIKGLYRVAVKPSWKGRVIACSFTHSSWFLRNLPNVLALQEFSYSE